MRTSLVFTLLLLLAPAGRAQEPVDTAMVRRIRAEAQDRSQVMEYAFFLTDVYGPRLTGSPYFRTAGLWAMETLRGLGLANVHEEPIRWDRGWSAEYASVHLVRPQPGSVIAAAVPWSPATEGPVEAAPVLAPLPDWDAVAAYEAFFDTWRGRLKGRIVLATDTIPQGEQHYNELIPRRLTDEELEARIRQQEAAAATPATEPAPDPDAISGTEYFALQDRLNRFLRDEGVVAVLYGSGHHGGTVQLNAGPARLQAAWLRYTKHALPPPSAVVASEAYNRILRLHRRGLPVTLRVDLRTRFYEDPANAFNIIAELPGTDARGEVVMLGAHFDAWTLGTGATDDAAGCAVAMEAMRILKALGVRPRRTIRLALWGGHEGEGLGSRTYVQQHFDAGYPHTWLDEDEQGKRHQPRPDYERLSAYFNLDYLAGRIRGVFLQENEGARPIFEAWLEPFRDVGAAHLSGIVGGGSDHMAFEDVGLPGFPFIQDGSDAPVLTHHSNMDVYDYLDEADLKQSAMILAAVVYHAATRAERMPRKPAPE
jgi:carboxypeptidase Q